LLIFTLSLSAIRVNRCKGLRCLVDHVGQTLGAQQSVTNIASMVMNLVIQKAFSTNQRAVCRTKPTTWPDTKLIPFVMNLIAHIATTKHELLFNKPVSFFKVLKTPLCLVNCSLKFLILSYILSDHFKAKLSDGSTYLIQKILFYSFFYV
jgi:hypothetical protein